MDDSISRADAIEAIRTLQTFKLFEGDDMILIDKAEVQTELMTLPSAEKTGKWIDTGSGTECSECHEIMYGYDNYRNYCQYCGSYNGGEQDGNV